MKSPDFSLPEEFTYFQGKINILSIPIKYRNSNEFEICLICCDKEILTSGFYTWYTFEILLTLLALTGSIFYIILSIQAVESGMLVVVRTFEEASKTQWGKSLSEQVKSIFQTHFTGGPSLARKSLTRSPTSAVLANVRASGRSSRVPLTPISRKKFPRLKWMVPNLMMMMLCWTFIAWKMTFRVCL